jgi:hypothetical protein
MVYLIEFRFHGYAKNLIYDVARKFNVKGVTENRAVPHISLFGPFQTNDERRLVSDIQFWQSHPLYLKIRFCAGLKND